MKFSTWMINLILAANIVFIFVWIFKNQQEFFNIAILGTCALAGLFVILTENERESLEKPSQPKTAEEDYKKMNLEIKMDNELLPFEEGQFGISKDLNNYLNPKKTRYKKANPKKKNHTQNQKKYKATTFRNYES